MVPVKYHVDGRDWYSSKARTEFQFLLSPGNLQFKVDFLTQDVEGFRVKVWIRISHRTMASVLCLILTIYLIIITSVAESTCDLLCKDLTITTSMIPPTNKEHKSSDRES